MATLSALSIVVKQDVPYLVQLAREEVDKARLEMERARMRAEDTREFQRVFEIGVAEEAAARILWRGTDDVRVDLDYGIEHAKDERELMNCVLSASRLIERTREDTEDAVHNAKATWRNNFRG